MAEKLEKQKPSKEEVLDVIRKTYESEFYCPPKSDDATIMDEHADDLDRIIFIMELESKLNIKIDFDEVFLTLTIDKMADCILEILSSK